MSSAPVNSSNPLGSSGTRATESRAGLEPARAPATMTEPESSETSPAAEHRSVVFPDPFGPTRPTTEPASTRRSIPPSATEPPNLLVAL